MNEPVLYERHGQWVCEGHGLEARGETYEQAYQNWKWAYASYCQWCDAA